MLITKLKDTGKLLESMGNSKVFVFKCFGCSEVFFPEEEVDRFIRENGGIIKGLANVDYLCSEEFAGAYAASFMDEINEAGQILVFSCGVGVQVVSKLLLDKKVFPGCDTFYINGFQGLAAGDSDCEQCGMCYLNLTGGICPLAACAKGLLNGPCGGASDKGKCEVTPEMECAWVRIYDRLKVTDNMKILRHPEVNIRDYSRIIKDKPASCGKREKT